MIDRNTTINHVIGMVQIDILELRFEHRAAVNTGDYEKQRRASSSISYANEVIAELEEVKKEGGKNGS